MSTPGAANTGTVNTGTVETGTGNSEQFRPVFGLPILVLSGMQLLVVLDGTVAALALPSIRDALTLSESSANWVISSYVLAFGGLMLLGGRLGDTFGRKRMFIVGVVAFTLTSLLCGLAWNEASLLAGRALQGASAAIAAPTAMALVATTFAPGKPRSQAFAVYAAMTGVGSVAGLILGGVLTELSWRLVFLINVPIGLIVVVGAIVALRESQGERLPLDVPGAVLGTLGCTLLVLAVNEGPNGWTAPVVVGSFILGALALAAFIVVERRARNPLLPFSLFDNSSLFGSDGRLRGYVDMAALSRYAELMLADEVFMTGTAAEVTPVRSVDRVPVGTGTPGPVTRALQAEFMGIAKGRLNDRHGWLTPVPVAASVR